MAAALLLVRGFDTLWAFEEVVPERFPDGLLNEERPSDDALMVGTEEFYRVEVNSHRVVLTGEE